MKTLRLILAIALLAIPAMATTHFVRSGASGSANGSSWANAWTDVANINWSSVSAGDTICVAGGSYGVFTSGTDGTSGNPITIERATASSGICGSTTTGWSSSYDSQVSLSYNDTLYNNYNTIDGIVRDGILVTIPNLNSNSLVAGWVFGGSTGTIVRNTEELGPCGTTTTCSFANVNAGYSAFQGSQSPYPNVNNLYIGYNDIYGVCNGFVLQSTNGIIEHNYISNTSTGNSATCHDNVIDSASLSGSMTFRYNDITNWDTEALMMQNTSGQVWYVYGNVFHDPKVEGNYARAIEAQDGSQTVYGYNNTFVNMPYAVYNTANGGTFSGSSTSTNDLFWNTNGSGMSPTDCAWGGSSGSSCGGSGAQNLGTSTSIFTNYSAHTAVGYDLASNTTAGVNLGSPYNVDYLGNTRTTWSRGAFEYQSGTNYTFSTATAGTGTGSISGSNCSTSTYSSGTSISCTASASGGSTFSGWSGTGSASGCSGTGGCSFTLSANSTVTATFALTVAVTPPTHMLIMVQ